MKEEWDTWKLEQSGKRWAKALGIEALDKDGTKTKTHVEQLISRWKSATLMMGTGWGNKSRKVKRDGEWVTEVVTAGQQLEEKCADFQLLDSFLGQKEVNEGVQGGLDESGLLIPLEQVGEEIEAEPDFN